MVRDGSDGRIERGYPLQLAHGLAVLRPEESGALEFVAGEQGTQPAAFGADIVVGGQAISIAATELAGFACGRRTGSDSRVGGRHGLGLVWNG